jgi:hypothetical protein
MIVLGQRLGVEEARFGSVDEGRGHQQRAELAVGGADRGQVLGTAVDLRRQRLVGRSQLARD